MERAAILAAVRMCASAIRSTGGPAETRDRQLTG